MNKTSLTQLSDIVHLLFRANIKWNDIPQERKGHPHIFCMEVELPNGAKFKGYHMNKKGAKEDACFKALKLHNNSK